MAKICLVIVAAVGKYILTLKMSKYYDTLSEESKATYAEKLKLAGLGLEEDPYDDRNKNKYKNDMTAWPPFEYGHILPTSSDNQGFIHRSNYFHGSSWKHTTFLNGCV